ncbi:PREDICTED: protein HOMOLOG OF MAMMALIAN LYST-INTERACTING PROTEIN 5 [Nelumbo nucifera]|uniref:Protein HOMOLOG OF MAMMALIAN LYST-INTERACTING PROTEIN 5 n=1 Tax=Nelumbo nucifera TaxID=4432 RepID=A0A1U8Q1Q1_NELNU|nr:PREDICTED: protein HOMOLOG OF MAMMALIAN LYST-INTERACTING PROTEIN 5 [Nelumbo nucifera]
MGSENEPAKLLLPYLQRADELQKHDLLVAYYCRLYAMERGLKIPQKDRTKMTNSLLISLMNQLEKDKKSLNLGPEDNLHLEGFALNVFAKADKQDRAGRADLNTTKSFYAASIFFEILNQFGELQPDLEQKQKYAVWKAADIRKALKEGRKPEPGPLGGDKDLSIPSSTPNGAYDLGYEPDSSYHPGPGSDALAPIHHDFNHQPSVNLRPPPTYPTADGVSDEFHQPPLSSRQEGHMQESSAYPPPPPPVSRQDNSAYPQPPPPVNRQENSAYSQPPPPVNRQDNSAYPQPPSPVNRQESSVYSQPHQPYQHEPQNPFPQTYPSHESAPSSYSYPHFQSYPSFTDSSLSTIPSHYPSYYQGSDASFSHQSSPPVSNYSSSAQYTSGSRNATNAEPSPTPAQVFHYDSNYEPPPEKIAEAHKAARFAVGALAFDDVPVAIDFLRKSLELLTNPSASQ